MKLLLALALLTLSVIPQDKIEIQQPSDLTVLKFRLEKRHGQVVGGGLVDTVRAVESRRPPPPRNEPERVRNNRDLQDRAAELRAGEQDAANSAAPAVDYYVYVIKLKNTGSKLIKSFVWEYEASPDTRDVRRQFFCVVKTKPNDTKELDVFSQLAPSQVVKADTAPNSSNQGRIIINKIVYGDSSVWQRVGWEEVMLSKTESEKLNGGRCIAL